VVFDRISILSFSTYRFCKYTLMLYKRHLKTVQFMVAYVVAYN